MAKKHGHEKHIHCEHVEVAFCGHCDVTYCKSCKQEWGECRLNHYNPNWWYTTPFYSGTTTTPFTPFDPNWPTTISTTGESGNDITSSDTYTTSVSDHAHAHN